MQPCVIGGMGPRASCSTVMNFVFDGLPGVWGAGDTHIILTNENAYCECEFSKANDAHGCPIYSKEHKQRLIQDKRNWFIQLANFAGTNIIYSQDRRIEAFELIDALPSTVVLYYRDPRAWVISEAVWLLYPNGQFGQAPYPEPLADLNNRTVRQAIERWYTWYQQHFAWLRANNIPYTSFNTDQFIDNPERDLEALCNHLNIQYDAKALRWWEGEHHKLGGRFNSTKGKQSRFGHKLARDQKWKSFLTDTQAELVYFDRDIRYVVKQLMNNNQVQKHADPWGM